MRHYLLPVAIVLASNLASAGPKTTAALVTEQLIQPLVAKERAQSKFSRARLPPSERRVRVLDKTEQQDSTGEVFFTFAVDSRQGWSDDDSEANWAKATITGCAYPGRGEVFIKRGNAYHPSAAALGKKTKAAPEYTCRAAPQLTAR